MGVSTMRDETNLNVSDTLVVGKTYIPKGHVKELLLIYESMKRKLLKPIYECRCNGRRQTLFIMNR